MVFGPATVFLIPRRNTAGERGMELFGLFALCTFVFGLVSSPRASQPLYLHDCLAFEDLCGCDTTIATVIGAGFVREQVPADIKLVLQCLVAQTPMQASWTEARIENALLFPKTE